VGNIGLNTVLLMSFKKNNMDFIRVNGKAVESEPLGKVREHRF